MTARPAPPPTLPLAAAREDDRLRVLHTVRSLRIDGVVKVVRRMVGALDSTRFVHHVCSMRPDEGLAAEFRAHGIEPLFVGHARAAHAPRSVRRLVGIIREHGIDVVHANRTLDLVLAGAAARVCGVPVVSSLHWLGRPEDHPEDDSPLWWQHLEKGTTALLNRGLAHRIVAVSEAVRDSFAEHRSFPARRVHVVYPGIDSRACRPDPVTLAALRRELGLEQATHVLVNVGRLHPVKGQRHLVGMMRRVREHRPGAHLVIAGDGELRDRLAEEITAAGLADRIHLVGARDDVDALLALADVVVVASESEAAPLPLFEAMRAGRAIVATAVGGIPEILQTGVTGHLVPRGDGAAMADAVLRILAIPGESRRMGEAGRALLRARFEIDRSARALEAIYTAVARRRSPLAPPDAPG